MEKNADQIGENNRTQLCGQSIILTRNSPDDKHFNSNGNTQYTVASPRTKENTARLPLKTQTKISKNAVQ
jgi:hypothetical protein